MLDSVLLLPNTTLQLLVEVPVAMLQLLKLLKKVLRLSASRREAH